MKMMDFVSGNDVQRSLNLADNRCINLYPTVDDSGSITAFYSTPGLSAYASAASIFSGLYTASNGRAFAVSGTVLYEITTGGTLTNRGTVTSATVSKMSDNGIELIIVNGTDGWLFTFATNALKKISTISADFTVTIASPAVFSTVAAHNLVAGDAIQLTTTTGLNSVSSELIAMPSFDAPNYSSGIVISPDGQNAYVVAQGPQSNGGWPSSIIYQYAIDTTGTLAPLSTATLPLPNYYIRGLKISDDGKYLYAASSSSPNIPGGGLDGVAIFSRNLTNGFLSFQSQANVVGTNSINSIGMSDIGASPSFYIHAFSNVAGFVYQCSRNITTGDIALYGTPSVTGTFGSAFGSKMSISADGLGVYVTSHTYTGLTPIGHIQGYLRSLTTGLLTALTDISDTTYPSVALISTDGAFAYVADAMNMTIRKYSRNLTTSVLTYVNSINTGIPGTTSIGDIVLSPDNTSLYCGMVVGNFIYQYDRNATTGDLTATTIPSINTDMAISIMAVLPNGKNVYAVSRGTQPLYSKIMTFSRQQSSSNAGLPTGLATLTTYYVIAAGLTANNFEVSLTAGGTAVNTSGVQAGIHTFHTIGNGFPNGAKTVSYIDGRFVVCQPNTQNFYVSDVLAGAKWDTLNVQTADSNPDMIVGQITLHNELIVFCEQSGETFYDSGTYPSPFVRNVSGIFEVGCIAPYSIAKIDNSVMWLGKSNTGQGVIYRLNGYTPIRLSTYAIEYAIQTMSTITDAQAFTYQQEGHHFYVITFPTGGRTFVFDINTGLWHERAGWNGSVLSRWAAKEYAYFDGKHLVCDYSAGNIYSMDLGVYTDGANAKKWIRSWRAPSSEMKRVNHNKLTLEAEVGVGPGALNQIGVVNSINMDNYGSSGTAQMLWQLNTISTPTAWPTVAWNGSIFCAISTVGTCATSPDGVTWTFRTFPAFTISTNSPCIAWNGSIFCAMGGQGTTNNYATSPDGITWTLRSMTLTASTGIRSICYGNGIFVAQGSIGGGSGEIYTSPDGITWTFRTGIVWEPISSNSVVWNGSLFCSIGAGFSAVNSVYTSPDGIAWTQRIIPATAQWTAIAYNGTMLLAISGNLGTAATSFDGITWTARTIPANQSWSGITTLGNTFCISAVNSNNTIYTTTDGITWTIATIQGAVLGFSALSSNGSYFVALPSTQSTTIATSYNSYSSAGTYAITFTGGGGSGAAGTYTISPTTGKIISTSLTNGGANYTTAPTISFTFGGITGAAGHVGMTWTQTSIPTGSALVSLKYSNDGGHTWSPDNWRDMSLGVIGQYTKRVFWYRLGMTTGQTRLYELSSTSAVKTVLISTYLE